MEDVDGSAGVNSVGRGAGRDWRFLIFVFLDQNFFKTRRKGTGWMTSVVPRVEMMAMLPRVPMMPEGCSAVAMVLCVGGGHGAL